jgi:hypothetical protein
MLITLVTEILDIYHSWPHAHLQRFLCLSALSTGSTGVDSLFYTWRRKKILLPKTSGVLLARTLGIPEYFGHNSNHINYYYYYYYYCYCSWDWRARMAKYEGGSKSFRRDTQKPRKWKMLRGIYSAIYGEVNVSVCVEVKGDCIEKQKRCSISVTLNSWSGRKLLDPPSYE